MRTCGLIICSVEIVFLCFTLIFIAACNYDLVVTMLASQERKPLATFNRNNEQAKLAIKTENHNEKPQKEMLLYIIRLRSPFYDVVNAYK